MSTVRPLLEGELLADLGASDSTGFLNAPTRVWARLYGDFLALFESRESVGPLLVLPAAHVISVGALDRTRPGVVRLSSSCETLELLFDRRREASRWRSTLSREIRARRSFAHRSFAPVRAAGPIRFFVDGADYFSDLADHIEAAQEEILIADWWLSPELHLRRDRLPLDDRSRLDRMVLAAARRGVQIFILLYQETALALGSERSAALLCALHPNIRVHRHSPSWRNILYSHHQKFVVIDQTTAFVGGLDLAFGRFDTREHRLADPRDANGACFFPGADYYHPAVREPDEDALADPLSDLFDRAVHHRMPWHDVGCRLGGDAARDVAVTFVQRWNQHHFQNEVMPPLVPLSPLPGRQAPAAPAGDAAGTCQVLRSLAEWNGGGFLETSIYRAMLDAIERARRLVYIEQQFFVSSLAGDPVENRIAHALLARISRAIREGSDLRVVVVMPEHPEGNYLESARVRALMGWQYRTICRQEGSLLGKLAARFPRVDLGRHVGFFCLRNHGRLGARPVTSQVYVHSKLMIVDDRIAIIGSANVNDRSLLGDRDSEIAVRVEFPDAPDNPVHGFRMALWNHHLGLPARSRATADPTPLSVYRDLWTATAESNAAIYHHVFPNIPRSGLRSLETVRTAGPGPVDPGRLEGVKGFLLTFPYDFLADEDLSMGLLDIESLLGDSLLT